MLSRVTVFCVRLQERRGRCRGLTILFDPVTVVSQALVQAKAHADVTPADWFHLFDVVRAPDLAADVRQLNEYAAGEGTRDVKRDRSRESLLREAFGEMEMKIERHEGSP